MPVLEGLYCPGINYTTGFPGGLFLVSIPWGSWGDYYWFLYHGVPERIITGFYTMGFPGGLFLVSISLYHGVPWGILLEDYQMNLILYFLDGVLTWYHFIFLDKSFNLISLYFSYFRWSFNLISLYFFRWSFNLISLYIFRWSFNLISLYFFRWSFSRFLIPLSLEISSDNW